MSSNETTTNKKISSKGLIYILFGAVMIVIYLGMAYLMLFSSLFTAGMPAPVRYLMGGVFLVYGVFRAYRYVRLIKRLNDN